MSSLITLQSYKSYDFSCVMLRFLKAKLLKYAWRPYDTNYNSGSFLHQVETSHFCITLWEYFIKISQALGIREYVVKLAEVKNTNWYI